MYDLNNEWTCWIHYQNNDNWTIDGYKKITKITNLKEAIILIENLHENIIKKSMLFFMKDNILPLWESDDNINGGSFSYKISNNIVVNVFKSLLYKILGNTIINDEIMLNNINGISISPKKNFCIIKIWIKEKNLLNNYNLTSNKDFFYIHKFLNIEEQLCVFKPHN